MKAIVAVDSNWGIGRDGDLLFRLPGDLAYFKEKTLGQIVVMGRKTAESMPGGRPLPGRKTIVLTGKRAYSFGDARAAASVDELLREIEGSEREVYVCGGGQVYELLLPHCEGALVTKVEAAMRADTHFPNLDENDEFAQVSESVPITEQGYTYRMLEYVRKERG